MGFDLNETFDPQFPYGFESTFDNEHFVWNIDHDQENEATHERGSPSRNTNIENAGANDDKRCSSDDFIESPLRDDEGIIHSSDGEDDPLEDENQSRYLIGEIEKRLAVGSILESLDQAYLFYCEYGRLVGFSVKKGSQKYYSRSAKISNKEYNCSCHGTSNAKQTSDRLYQFKKQDFRTNCGAMLRVVGKDGKYVVSKFMNDHNHELSDPKNSYLLRSSRNLSHAKKSLLESLHSSGIRIKAAYRFMGNEAGGVQNIGFTTRDAYNHMASHRKKSRLDVSDSNSLVMYFMERSNKEHDFYWNMQTDDEGRLLNFFFRDSRSALDYDFFRDVLSVDTTYKTNKYDLICAPFVGVNHHMKNCLFGLAFISDETSSTFEWLFSTFLDSMHGKEPGVVFSDKCQAMMNAIDSQFKSSTHRLCQWNINQNSPSHFGSLNNNQEFKALWFRCMNGCETIEEFECTWKRMLDDYELVENRWFRTMYNLRARWSSVFSRDKFCAGLHATSRSEVTNKVLKDLTSSASCLYEFVIKYQQLQLDWRQMEDEDDTACLGVPGLLVSKNPILKQAANYLTRRVFLSYEYEATHSLNVDILQEHLCDERGNLVEFHIKDCETPSRIRRVTYNRMTSEVSCSCCLWESVGVLCSHVFKIYYHENVKVIPSIYLLRRLSREAKRRRGSEVLSEGNSSSRGDNQIEDKALNSYLMRTTYDLIHDSRLDFNMKGRLLKVLKSLRDEMLSMPKECDNQGGREPVSNFRNAAERPLCRDPVIPQNRRFTTTRLSRHWEKPRRKLKKKTHAESGSRMNIHISKSHTASPSTSNTNFGGGRDLISASLRHGFTPRSKAPNFYATQ